MRKIMAVVLAFCMMLGCTLSGMAFTALDNDENIVRIGIMADAHIFDNSKAVNDVITAFEALDESLDGIVMGGDIVANAPTELLPNLYDAAVADTKLSAYLTKKPAVETATRTIDEAEYSVGTNSGEGSLVWVMGNHEFNTNNNDVAQPEAWKLFQEKTGFGIRGNVKMGGYHFIYSAAQGYIGRYTEEDQNWMLDELKAVLADENYAGKPVFLVLHHPIPESYHDTTNGANGSNFITGHYTEEFVSFVKSQPRIIEFSAHTHYPIQDPRMIRQPELGGFTAVQIPFAGNGTFTLDRSADVRTAPQEDSYGQALMLEIDKTTNIVTIKRLNIATGEFIGNDWTVDVAELQNGNGYSYTDARFENGEAPVFSEGDVEATNIAQSTATITFPAATKFSAATETSYANIYDVKVVNKNTNVVEFSKTMCSDYYKLSPADSFSIDVDNLEADTAYIAKITAISPYGAQSDVKSGEFTTESAVAEGGEALSKIVIDVNSEIEKSTLDKASDHYGGWIGGGSRTQIISKITPEITGVYDISVLASFTSDAPDMTVFVDGIEVNTVATSIATGLSSPTKYEIGSIGLLAGKTYTVELSCAKATGGYANYWYNTTLVCNREIGVGDIVVTGDKVLPGVDDQGENPKVTLKALNYVGSAESNDQRWNNWISGEAYAVLWNFTPEFTGMYDFTTDVKFSSNGKDGYASVYIDGVQLTDWATATPGSATVETLNLGSALLIEGKTYEIKVKLKSTSGITGAIYGAAINCSGKASDDALAENANIELRANDTSNIISHNYNGCNSDRFHWWNGEGNAFIEWGITPLATGIYEISALAGYSLESYSETPYLEAYIDGNKVGEAQYPEDFTDSAPDRNKETFGKLLLEGGKTYTLRLLLKGGGYNVYLKGMDVKFLRSPQTEDFWQDSVIVNGWEPAEKYTAGEVENYGVIIAQKNHYATYKVNPGEGFFKLSITYGAGSSLTGNAPITLNVNGKDLGTIIAPDNDCYWPSAGNAACTLDLGVIKLKEGENTITLGHEGSTDVYYSVGKVMVDAIKAPIESLYRGKYVDSDDLITDVVNGEMTAYAQLPRSMAGKSLTAVFAVYESKANGKKLVAVASDSFDIDTTGEISLTVENVVTSSASSYSYRIFYVEADNSLNPIF